MVRGVQNILAPQRIPMIVLGTPPAEWTAEMAGNMAGAIVFPQEVTQQELNDLKNRNIPFILVGETSLTGPRVQLGQAAAARKMTETLLQLGHRRIALLSGFDREFDAAKRDGVHQALRAAHIDPVSVPEYAAGPGESGCKEAVQALLALKPRPTAIVAFADSLAAPLSLLARREERPQDSRRPEHRQLPRFTLPSLSRAGPHHRPFRFCRGRTRRGRGLEPRGADRRAGGRFVARTGLPTRPDHRTRLIMIATSERPSVLLVDDNPMVLRAMTLLLGSVGWKTFEAGHAEQALEQLKWRDYDLAIVDLRMPDTDGIELCRLILLHNQVKKPVIFIHSGYIDAPSRERAMETGIQGILDKPIGRDELIDTLKKFNLPCSA